MNIRRGFRRITLVLAIAAAAYCAIWAGKMVVNKHRTAWRNIQWREEAKREGYAFKTIAEGFWGTLPKEGLVILCILAGAGGAVAGYCGICVVHKLVEWLAIGFYGYPEGKLAKLAAKAKTEQWDKDKLLTTVAAYKPACVIAAAVDLDVFGGLEGKSMTAQSVACELGTDARATAVLLDALAAMQLLSKQNGSYKVPQEVAEALTGKGVGDVSAAVRHHGNCLRRWVQLAQVVQSGRATKTVPGIRGETAEQIDFIEAMREFAEPIVLNKRRRKRP